MIFHIATRQRETERDSVLSGSDVAVSASESVRVSAGDSVNVGVVSDVDISAGGKLVGRVAESVEVVSGSASLASGSSIDVVSGEVVSVSAGGDTATGPASTSTVVDVTSAACGETISPLILSPTPPVASVGKLVVDEGRSSVWTAGKDPIFIKPGGFNTSCDIK